MSLRNVRSRRSRLGILAGLIASAVAAAAIGLVVPGAGNQEASAQVRGCDLDQFGVLCLIKDAPDSRIPFVFEIERDQETRFTLEEIPCVVPDDFETEYTEVLRGGDAVEIDFGCGIRVIERREPGWNLVDVLCDYEDDYYDVRREDGGIMILVDRSAQDTFVGTAAVRRNIECVFVNRPEPRPNLGGGLGGLFAGQPTPLPTAVAPAATAPVITPPRTGDAGLK